MKIDFKKSNYALKRELNHIQPYDIAEIFPGLEPDEQIRVMQLIGVKKTAVVFSRLSEYQQKEVYEQFEENKRKQILDNLEIDELKEFVGYFDQYEQEKILSIVKPVKSNLIRDLLIYSNDLAPSIMSTEFLKIEVGMTVKQVTSYIFNNVKDEDFIDNIYVVDEDDKLLGVISLKSIIIARADDSIRKLIDTDFLYAYNDSSIQDAIEIVRNYDITSLPVIDHSGYLLGIITADDVLEQLIMQYDEAYNRLGFLKNHDESYTGFQRSMKRLPWLIIATILNLIIAAVLASVPAFEATIATIVTLVLFQPMILDMAGNIGTQNLAAAILGLHKKELETKQERKTFIKKEALVSIFNSLVTAIIGFTIAAIVTSFSAHQSIHGVEISALRMGSVVGAALFVAMALSGILGTFLPILLTRNNINADNATGPILTTLNDIIALFTYYGVAALLLMTL